MSRKKYKEKCINGEYWSMVETPDAWDEWAIDGFWKDGDDFERDTGVSYEVIEGKWFQVVHGRVYLEEDQI